MNNELRYKDHKTVVGCVLSHLMVDFESASKKCCNGSEFTTFIFNDAHDDYRYTLSLFSDGKIALRRADCIFSSAECYECYMDNSKIVTVTRYNGVCLECRIYNTDKTCYRILWSVLIGKPINREISEE